MFSRVASDSDQRRAEKTAGSEPVHIRCCLAEVIEQYGLSVPSPPPAEGSAPPVVWPTCSGSHSSEPALVSAAH